MAESGKDVKAPNVFERLKEEMEAVFQSDKHHKETHGLNYGINENTSMSDVKAPNVFERAKEEFEALAEAINAKKGLRSEHSPLNDETRHCDADDDSKCQVVELRSACTYRLKRCGADCVFAPYFPAEKAEDFDNVNWLFGVQNAINILRSVTEDERSKTAQTMMIEARIRRENPVHGPLAIEKKLRDEIEILRKEMEVVQKQLDLNKSKGKDKVG